MRGWAAVGAATGGVVGAIAGVAAAGAISGSLDKAAETNEDAFLGMVGMFFGAVIGAAVGGVDPPCRNATGTVSGPPPELRFP